VPVAPRQRARENAYGGDDLTVGGRGTVQQEGGAPQGALGWREAASAGCLGLERVDRADERGQALDELRHERRQPVAARGRRVEQGDRALGVLASLIETRVRSGLEEQGRRIGVPRDRRESLAAPHDPAGAVEDDQARRRRAHHGVRLTAGPLDGLDAVGHESRHPSAGTSDGATRGLLGSDRHAPPYPIEPTRAIDGTDARARRKRVAGRSG
jgi:hypothetical protein